MNTQRFFAATILLLSLGFFVSNISQGQRLNRAPEVRWGVRAGFNMSDLTNAIGLDRYNGLSLFNDQGEYVGFHDTKPFQFGFNAGISMQVRLSDDFWFEGDLIYNTKGYKVEEKDVNIDAEFNYITLPLSAVYKYELSDNLKLFAEGGGFLGVGVGGYTIFEDNYGSDSSPRIYRQETENPRTYDATVHGKTFFWYDKDRTFEAKGTYRFDTGLQIGLGVEFWRFKIGLTYQLSVTPIYNYGADFSERYLAENDTVNTNSFNYFQVDYPTCPKHQVLSLSVTYYLDNIFTNRRW